MRRSLVILSMAMMSILTPGCTENTGVEESEVKEDTVSSRSLPEKHAHSSPHGGLVKTAGDYHIEMVSGHDKLIFLFAGWE
ncbi:MAG: hypothetical protein M3Q97_00235 [Bacteroidota bacterium]|nr:hypothetical protein [Bacteroidota bacterium]